MIDHGSEAQSSWANEQVIGEVPFAVEVHLSLIQAYERVNHANVRYFARWGLTPQQYNVLRILYFADEGGLRLSEISERLLQRVPDVSRLIVRIERAGLCRRTADPADGRAVLVEPTAEGRSLIERMDADLLAAIERWYSPLTPAEQRRFVSLLEKTVAVFDSIDPDTD